MDGPIMLNLCGTGNDCEIDGRGTLGDLSHSILDITDRVVLIAERFY